MLVVKEIHRQHLSYSTVLHVSVRTNHRQATVITTV